MRQGRNFPAHFELVSYYEHSSVQQLFCENQSKNPKTNPAANLSVGKDILRGKEGALVQTLLSEWIWFVGKNDEVVAKQVGEVAEKWSQITGKWEQITEKTFLGFVNTFCSRFPARNCPIFFCDVSLSFRF